MPLKPVVKKQSLHRESLPLRLNWIVPMTKGQQLAVSFTYRPGWMTRTWCLLRSTRLFQKKR